MFKLPDDSPGVRKRRYQPRHSVHAAVPEYIAPHPAAGPQDAAEAAPEGCESSGCYPTDPTRMPLVAREVTIIPSRKQLKEENELLDVSDRVATWAHGNRIPL